MARRFLSLMMAAALLAAAPAYAQRASLADRVGAIEQQLLNASANQDMLNQLQQLRTQMQEMQSSVEQLQHENEQLKQRARDQYLDLDGRLERLEGGSPDGQANAQAVAPATAPPAIKPDTERAPTVRGDAGAMASANEERAAYNVAFDALKAGRFNESGELFLSFLELFPSGVYAPNALYWLGESHYAAGRYVPAQQFFGQLLERYPTHDKASGSLLKLGLSQYNAGNLAAAETTLLQVGQRFSGSDAARTAADRLQSLRLGQRSLR